MITIYWSVDHRVNTSSLRIPEPENVYKRALANKDLDEIKYHRCPAVRDYMKNVFALKSPYEFEFEVTDEGIVSGYYDQDFFDRHVVVRSMKERLFSFMQYTIFTAEQDDVEVSFESPWFEDNQFTRDCIYLPGKMNIGKYYRQNDFGFHLRSDVNKFAVKMDDAYCYLRVHTDQPVQFKRYYMTDKLLSFTEQVACIKENKPFLTSKLEYFYEIFGRNKNLKSLILKEIKENIIS